MKSKYRLGGCSYSPKGGMDDANYLSCAEVHGDYYHQGNPYEGPQRKKQPPLVRKVTVFL